MVLLLVMSVVPRTCSLGNSQFPWDDSRDYTTCSCLRIFRKDILNTTTCFVKALLYQSLYASSLTITATDVLTSYYPSLLSPLAAAMDQIVAYVKPVREFAKDSMRLVKRCTKPDLKGV